MRIQQREWDNPVCKDWLEVLENTLSRLTPDVVLVAHSLACALVPHWAKDTKQKVRGALLVAPPDPDGPAFPTAAVGFSPLPLNKLPFPSLVVASKNDPYASIEFAESAATAWGSHFVNIGDAGHINTESGLGEWNDGFSYFKRLLT
jgi:predicted alpha/beta hydrolase family esterase